MTTVNLNEELTQKCVNMPESGMGYQVVNVHMRDRTVSQALVFNCSTLVIEGFIHGSDISDLTLAEE